MPTISLEKYNYISKIAVENPDWTVHAISVKCGVSETTVRNIKLGMCGRPTGPIKCVTCGLFFNARSKTTRCPQCRAGIPVTNYMHQAFVPCGECEPTPHYPGTTGKIVALRHRASHGLTLHHPLDAQRNRN